MFRTSKISEFPQILRSSDWAWILNRDLQDFKVFPNSAVSNSLNSTSMQKTRKLRATTYRKVCLFDTTRSIIEELNLCQRSYSFSRTNPRFHPASRLTTAKNTRSRTIHLFASRTIRGSASRGIFFCRLAIIANDLFPRVRTISIHEKTMRKRLKRNK